MCVCVVQLPQRHTVRLRPGTHGGGVVQDPHAIGLDEGFPAQLDVGDVPEAGQQPFADQHVAMPRVVAVPVLVERQQDGHATAVGGSPCIRLCGGWRQKMGSNYTREKYCKEN